MARFSKQKIKKDNYHDFIFYVCRNRINQTDLATDRINEIKEALQETANIIAREEYNVIEAYNADNQEAINTSLNRTVDDLDDFYQSDDGQRFHKSLKKTFKFVQTYKKNYSKKQMTLLATQVDNIVSKKKESLPTIELTVQKAFLTYYRIVSLIVEDINNLPGWKEISDFYKRKYHQSLNPAGISAIKPLTFLSYAFKDNIYALFLFDVFEQNNGFLYVDSLFGTDFGNDGSRIKNALSPWIDHSSQILFLHSIHSDKVKKGLSSWCSWELGEAYKSNNDQPKGFFKVVVAGIRKEDAHPIIDHHFKELDKVVDGIIIPK